MRGRVLAALVLALLLLAVLAAGAWAWLRADFAAPGPLAQATRIEVDPGASVRTVIARLGRSGAIAHARAVEAWLRLTGRSLRIQAGTYEIPAHATPAQIIELLEQGRVILEQVTVIEGSRFAEFRAALDAHAAVAHTLRGKSDAQVMQALGHAGEFPEGRFFPDTYRFAARTSDREILAMAYDAMQRLLATSWPARSADLPLRTPYETLILASVVEKESALPAERPRIAGVFVSRLRRGMRLQSDPTVIYGLGADYDGQIHTRDLASDTPYNTYTRAGLPPTPIALPSRESVLAALHPQDTGELYFVATGLGDGAHQFSRTLEEHNRAVQAYLRRLRGGVHGAAAAPGGAQRGKR